MRPDLVVMDARLPGMNGLRATEAILAELPSTKEDPFKPERIIERLHASLGPAPEGCGVDEPSERLPARIVRDGAVRHAVSGHVGHRPF